MKKNRSVHIANGSVSPEQQTKVYLGNKVRVRANSSLQSGGSYKKRKYADGGCGCGNHKNPKQLKKMVK